MRIVGSGFAVAFALTVGGAVHPAAAESMSLNVVEHATTDIVTPTGDADDNPGDLLTFGNEVFDEANQTKVGTDNGWCIRTVVGEAWECFWTLSLNEGQITVEGPYYDSADSVLAITGGTGAYAGARGEMGLHARDAEGNEYDFRYQITR